MPLVSVVTGCYNEEGNIDDLVARIRQQFAQLPGYDYGTYTFIADYLPWANGDGMEHRNSTILTSGSSLASNPGGILGTVSHEYFHQWNVERIRPAELEPFDFERANMTAFAGVVAARHGAALRDYASLRRWSVEQPADFWAELWRFADVRASRGWERVLENGDRMPGARWFAGARLNFAENLLRHRDDRRRRRGTEERRRRGRGAAAGDAADPPLRGALRRALQRHPDPGLRAPLHRRGGGGRRRPRRPALRRRGGGHLPRARPRPHPGRQRPLDHGGP